MTNQFQWGLGLRASHFEDWHAQQDVPTLEVMTDNLIHHSGGPALWHTRQLAQRAPAVVLHGVGLNIGGCDPISNQYLEGLRELIERLKPAVVSDHLCFTQFNGLQSYELLPLERTETSIRQVSERVDRVQQKLGRQIALENASSYVEYNTNQVPEPEFINRIVHKTGCGLLLDVNNLYVNAHNFRRDPFDDLNQFEIGSIVQLHIAGHTQVSDFLFDTHDSPVCEPVWQLLFTILKQLKRSKCPPIPIILENDSAQTSLSELLNELELGQRKCIESETVELGNRKLTPRELTDPRENYDYQRHFVDFINTLEKPSAKNSRILASIDDKFAYRLETYQSSYLGRITTNLAESLFEECQSLFGNELTSQILAGFFKNNPPKANNLINAADRLPEYLRTHTDSPQSLLFADLSEICIQRWALLTDADPTRQAPTQHVSLDSLYLMRTARLIKPCAHHNLYACWTLAQLHTVQIPNSVFEKSSGVLLAKTSATELSVIDVPMEIVPLIEALRNGASLSEAVQFLASHARGYAEAELNHEVQRIIAALASCNALTLSHEEHSLS